MAQVRAKWLAFYSERVEPISREIFSHVEKMIIGTLIVSAGAHVSSTEPSVVLFGYLRHGLIGRGVMLFGAILLLLNFLDGLYKPSSVAGESSLQALLLAASYAGYMLFDFCERGGRVLYPLVRAVKRASKLTA